MTGSNPVLWFGLSNCAARIVRGYNGRGTAAPWAVEVVYAFSSWRCTRFCPERAGLKGHFLPRLALDLTCGTARGVGL